MTDHDFMVRALTLAERGRGHVEPNPLVGAVIVRDGLVVGEGWHERFGQAHAEVNAFREAGDSARGATVYVTLEPCCHFGKTPPCTDTILRAGASRVVAAMLDPFPQVAGQGANLLRSAGITVEVGTCEAAARQLNAPYLKRLRSGRPWVHAKWAATLDGKIATVGGESKWITGPSAREEVHRIRGRMDAIIIGRRTLLADDPLLTARPAGPRLPMRVVLTTTGNLPNSCKLLDTIGEAPVAVYTGTESQAAQHWADRGAIVQSIPPGEPKDIVGFVLADLGRRGSTNVLIEGGGEVIGQFLQASEIDEVHAFIAPKIFGGSTAPSPVGGSGIKSLADAVELIDPTLAQLGPDFLVHGMTSTGHRWVG